ncbi:hypothetical protein SAMN04487943_10451 [Gracilibacillus orientalis]|uniref:Alpha-L-rhamnosidase C-terminal domain-containing protein n=1 Tax=Gracilibacillus orientalis TaxID=334253 RepID=A0A1I4KN05_9BACI|nr:alpha-L-rhamnosidase C-terminal domain-containing protein [Gracilibacillus orientalis]SFL80144.1 hypothetical protein SAMN04487943_10451 [Gracilibacillus orientalis]
MEIKPSLGDLEWVEGSFPTPYGNLKVKHYKQKDGSIETSYEAPDEIEIII